MKKALASLLMLVGLFANAQDYKFDYLLEYTNEDGDHMNYYINSKDVSYMLSDSNYKQIVTDKYIAYFAVPYSGKPWIYDVIPDKYANNPAKVEELKSDNAEVMVNGYKCKKYLYKTTLTDGEDETVTHTITYEYYITQDAVNSIPALNANEMLFPDSIKFNGFPKGTVVKVSNAENDYYKAFTQLSLIKITKLDKPLVLEITNQQVTDYLLNNQAN